MVTVSGLGAYRGIKGEGVWQRYGLWLLAAALCLLIGLVAGIITAADIAEQNSELGTFADTFLKALPELAMDSSLETGTALAGNWRFFAVIWFLGLSVFGIPLVGLLLFLRGFALGFSVSFLVGRQLSAGLLVAILGVLPQNLLLVPAMIIAGTLAAVFAQKLWHGKVLWRSIGVYSGCFILIFLVTAVAAWLQGYVSPVLLKGVLSLI